MALMVKNPPANAEDIRDLGLIPGSGRSPGGGHGNPLQYSCLENAMDRGAWWATVQSNKESDMTELTEQACMKSKIQKLKLDFFFRIIIYSIGIICKLFKKF